MLSSRDDLDMEFIRAMRDLVEVLKDHNETIVYTTAAIESLDNSIEELIERMDKIVETT